MCSERSGLCADEGCGAMPRPEHLAGQRLRRRPDKCDAGRRRHKLHITRFRRCRRRKLAHSAVPPLPTETASLGFGGNPIQGGDKSSRKRKPLRLFGAASFAGKFAIYSRKARCFFCWLSRNFSPFTQRYSDIPVWGYHYPRRVLHAGETLGAQGSRWLNSSLPCILSPSALRAHTAAHRGKHGGVLPSP